MAALTDTPASESDLIAPVRAYLEHLYERIVSELSALDAQRFERDAWTRVAADALQGRGITCLLEGGALFERAGVGFSLVRGAMLPPSASASRPELAGRGFEALGISLVIHPRNPYVPTVHMNARCFVASSRPDDATPVWWFGGSLDLTPCYVFDEDGEHFHRTCRDALASIDPDLYPKFKAWCDRYFFIRHRNETRGIGGIFFDDFVADGDFDRAFAVARATGDSFLRAYAPIVARRREMTYGQRERDFQAYRRGRYVEFNLVYDRGTLFGLQSGGRTESILMSMPPIAHWRYDWHAESGTPEAALQTYLSPREWIRGAD